MKPKSTIIKELVSEREQQILGFFSRVEFTYVNEKFIKKSSDKVAFSRQIQVRVSKNYKIKEFCKFENQINKKHQKRKFLLAYLLKLRYKDLK